MSSRQFPLIVLMSKGSVGVIVADGTGVGVSVTTMNLVGWGWVRVGGGVGVADVQAATTSRIVVTVESIAPIRLTERRGNIGYSVWDADYVPILPLTLKKLTL